MTDTEDEREDKYRAFQQQLENAVHEMNHDPSEKEDAPFGVCWRNLYLACTPACNAFVPFDVNAEGERLQHGERCEVLVNQRVQARALAELVVLMRTSKKVPTPTANSGVAPPPAPGKAR